MSNIIKSWNNRTIRWRQEDQYGCLTDMAQANDKRVNDWIRLNSTTEYIQALAQSAGIPADLLIQVNESSGANEQRGTWAHRRVCIRFAQWCSAEFAVQVDTWVEELLTTGSVSLTDKALPHDYLSALKALVASEEEKLALIEQKEQLEGRLGFVEDILTGFCAIIPEEAALSFKQIADALRIKGLGRTKLMSYLRSKRFLSKRNVPYHKAIEGGFAVVDTKTYQDRNGNVRTIQATRLTMLGVAAVVKWLQEDGFPVNVTAEQIWTQYLPAQTNQPQLEAAPC